MAPAPEQALQALRPAPVHGQPYCVPIPGTERPNRTVVYRHWRFVDRPLLITHDPEIKTIHDQFERSVQKFGSRKCLGKRRWNAATREWDNKFTWLTYAEVAEKRKNFGAGLVEVHRQAGVTEEKFTFGIWSQNRVEWQIADLAAGSQSLCPVSLYETLGPDTTEYIVKHAELFSVICSLPHIPTLLQLAPRLPSLKMIISMDSLDDGEVKGTTKSSILNQMAANLGIKIYSMDELEKIGAESGRPMNPCKADDICTINYTSGTTGPPKGVVLTHANALAAVSAGRMDSDADCHDVHLSFLPLAHIYGRLVDQMALAEGCATGYYRGDITGLVDDIKILQPTGLMAVPRLFNRFNSAIRAQTVEAEGTRGALSKRVISTKIKKMREYPYEGSQKHWLYDRFWTPKVRAAVGLNRTHTMLSGSAQLDPDVQEFLRAAFGARFTQGYGLTESYATGIVQSREDFTTGNIGGAMGCMEVCLESVPELEYTVNDKPHPRGEIMMRGTPIFKGYYKNEEETKKVLEPDGWFHTGDIAEIDDMGRVRIIDRKKNVLKLSQGEYVSPERIENVYLGNLGVINTAFVHGDGTESQLVAVFGIEPDMFAPYASKILHQQLDMSDHKALKAAANNPSVKADILKRLDKIGREHKFNSFEKVANVYLDIDPFTIDNGLLTPTLKSKRPQSAKAFRPQIDQMYKEIKAQLPKSKSKL